MTLSDFLPSAISNDPVAEFFIDNGAIVAGATAFGTAIGFGAGQVARDFGWEGDPNELAQRIGGYGAIFGLALVVARVIDG